MLLDPQLNLTLRPMQYPVFYEMYRQAIRNTWTVDEVDFSTDLADLRSRLTPAERHLINRLVAFFATGDSIVSNNLALNLYKHINSPEARMYLSRQLYEEALHVQFYLTLLDTYIPDLDERAQAFKAIESIPSIREKAQFCFRWMDSVQNLDQLNTIEERRQFLLNLICFATCIEGLFFFAAFAYVYFLRSKGLLHGLAAGTNWVFRDESCVADGTEVLTPRGWVGFRDLNEADLVAQFDLQSNAISFVRPLRIIRKRYSGPMHRFQHRKGGMHQLLTPDHDMVQKWAYQRQYSKCKADAFVPNGKKQIPVSGYKDGTQDVLDLVDRFKLAFQADGSMDDRYTGERCGTIPVRFTFTKERKINRLRQILDELGWPFATTQRTDGQTQIKVDVPVEHKPSKLLRDWVDISDKTSGWCREFLDELIQWDGYIPPEGEAYYRYYSSIEEANIDTIQMIAVLCGHHVSRGTQTDERKASYNKVHRAYIHEIETVSCGTLLHTLEEYDGYVNCVTVPTGAFVIRYDDKVSITGNCHMHFAFEVIKTVRQEEPELFDEELGERIARMIDEAIECETLFAQDLLSLGVAGLSTGDMRQYLEYVADQRLTMLELPVRYHARNPFPFMDLQDVQELANFFERRVSAYQVGVTGEVAFNEAF